jgi:UDP-3-O-[3-hydroxymyristoyl] glucosamine N-acyltransferase
MKITNEVFIKLFGIDPDFPLSIEELGLSNTTAPAAMSFIDDTRYLQELNANANIAVVIATPELSDKVAQPKKTIVADDPRYVFYTLLNHIGEVRHRISPTFIDPTAVVHPTAYVAPTNVVIGAHSIVEPNVTILEDVEIGKHCIIRAGSVIGAEGFEQKRTIHGILAVKHFGKVIIHDHVHIGCLNGVSKGMSLRDTIVGESTRTDNLVHIAHGVHLGKRCLLPAACMIAGSVTIGDDVWIGPNASISSGIKLDKSSFVTIGSVVTRAVGEGETVTGNFAIPHKKFLRNLKNSLND